LNLLPIFSIKRDIIMKKLVCEGLSFKFVSKLEPIVNHTAVEITSYYYWTYELCILSNYSFRYLFMFKLPEYNIDNHLWCQRVPQSWSITWTQLTPDIEVVLKNSHELLN
jgi:hypothetical protein